MAQFCSHPFIGLSFNFRLFPAILRVRHEKITSHLNVNLIPRRAIDCVRYVEASLKICKIAPVRAETHDPSQLSKLSASTFLAQSTALPSMSIRNPLQRQPFNSPTDNKLKDDNAWYQTTGGSVRASVRPMCRNLSVWLAWPPSTCVDDHPESLSWGRFHSRSSNTLSSQKHSPKFWEFKMHNAKFKSDRWLTGGFAGQSLITFYYCNSVLELTSISDLRVYLTSRI